MGSLEFACMSRIHSDVYYSVRSCQVYFNMPYLTLRRLSSLDAETGLVHGFFNHSDWDSTLSLRVDAFLGDYSGNLFPQGGELVLSLLLSNLNLSSLQNLKADYQRISRPIG